MMAPSDSSIFLSATNISRRCQRRDACASLFPSIIVCLRYHGLYSVLILDLASISPDGRTLLSVGDTSKVFLHRLTGGSHINISPIATLSLPPPDVSVLPYASTALVASFSTSFSSDGTKYAVASQEGVVAVWDVRSTKPLKTFQTDKSRVPLGNGGATGWLSDDPWEWTRGSCKAPGWSVRNVKFSQGGRNGIGKEILAFTEVSFSSASCTQIADFIQTCSIHPYYMSWMPARSRPKK